ncbi:unnamed protein product [Caenorhabditis auriculariae]|uniref:Vang-like protein n=1 Tax=Caenorhabditis auriculariae TaxID=2777116 RepID=A0A8S1HIJ5_9PELO|nr:unnamed protein product [Caenorhabditis auriculariae]
MSVVSAGGRRGPPKDARFRYDPRMKNPRGRGYAQSDVGEPFIPRFSAVANEGVKLSMPHDEWGDNTTVITGVTSEHSYNGDEKSAFSPPIGRVVGRRCSRLFWLFSSCMICLIAMFSAPAMCSIPVIAPYVGFDTPPIVCDIDCQGLLLLLVLKSVLLIVAIWALFWRKSLADMPRLYLSRAALTFLVLFILFAFWLFYIVRILFERYDNYKYIVSFSLSLLDALLYTHYLSVVLLELRKMRKQFIVTIVRDPDGESKTMTIGATSIQEAATEILQFYISNFPSYNFHLDKARHSATSRPGVSQGGAGFKMYNIEQCSGQEMVSEVNTRALMEAAARRRIAGYSEIMQEEMDFERRLKKRKYRLMAAAEDAFSHVQSAEQHGTNGKSVQNQMDSLTAAQNVFTWIVRPLTKYLKTTRLLPRHPSEVVTRHIERCLTLKLSHRTFLQRFFSDRIPTQDVVTESKWSLICAEPVSDSIQHGMTIVMRSHNQDADVGIQLVCTISSIPFFNLTEQSRTAVNKFALRISNESSV